MPDVHEYIDWGRKMVDAARGDGGKHKDEILDGIEGHFDSIEREVEQLPSQQWLVVYDDNSGFQGLANVNVVIAESETAAKEKVADNSANYGNVKVYRIGELTERSDEWSYYR